MGPISNHSQIARCCENVDTQGKEEDVLVTDGMDKSIAGHLRSGSVFAVPCWFK